MLFTTNSPRIWIKHRPASIWDFLRQSRRVKVILKPHSRSISSMSKVRANQHLLRRFVPGLWVIVIVKSLGMPAEAPTEASISSRLGIKAEITSFSKSATSSMHIPDKSRLDRMAHMISLKSHSSAQQISWLMTSTRRIAARLIWLPPSLGRSLIRHMEIEARGHSTWMPTSFRIVSNLI